MVLGLCAALAGAYVFVLSLPFGRRFYELALLGPRVLLIAFAGSAIAIGGLVLVDPKFVPAPLRARLYGADQ